MKCRKHPTGHYLLGGRIYYNFHGTYYVWHIEIGSLSISWTRKGVKW